MNQKDDKKSRGKPKIGQAASTELERKLNLHAAGIDVGSEEHWVCVPSDHADTPVRKFGAFTVDLEAAANWLVECGITTVAMESTGSYWIPLYDVLEAHGLVVVLTNTHNVKYAPRRKTDMLDCQWIQYLHSIGMLSASFRPDVEIRALRTFLRHRDNLTRDAATHVQRVQKALIEMNVLLHNVISDITGVSGRRILDAILVGERNPDVLAGLAHARIQASSEEIANALQGHWQEEPIFVIRQSLAAYDHFHSLIDACDVEIEKKLAALAPFERPPVAAVSDSGAASTTPPVASQGIKKPRRKPTKNTPKKDLLPHLVSAAGVDLTEIPGIEVVVFLILISEIGRDVSKWRNAKAFASWLDLAPKPQISGGRTIGHAQRRYSNRAARALRMAAQSASRSNTYLGAYYRRLKSRLGPRHAMKALAHKLALLVYHMLRTGQSYRQIGCEEYEARFRERAVNNLVRRAKELGFQVSPVLPA